MTLKKQIMFAVLLLTFAALFLPGCRDKDKKKANAEANKARAELVKLKAEMLNLKTQKALLNEKLRTATLARDQLARQLNELIEQHDELADEAENSQQSNEQLIVLLEEQVKKVTVLQKQNEQLKAVVEQLRTIIKQQQARIVEQLATIKSLQERTAPEPVVEQPEPNETGGQF